MSLKYHNSELAIALNPEHPLRALPTIQSHHASILDVGCGIGQSLLGCQIPHNAKAFGIDLDTDAIRAGSALMPRNITLLCAAGESLPFKNEQFDLVFSRVSLPYMNITDVLGEFFRVLRPGGDVWLVLHPARMTWQRMKQSAGKGDVMDVAFSCFVLLNGLSFHFFNEQFSLLGRKETFQTVKGMERSLTAAGFSSIRVSRSKHFIVQAQKQAAFAPLAMSARA